MTISAQDVLRASMKVNSTDGGNKEHPDVLMLSDGTAIVSWDNRTTGETRAVRINAQLDVFGPDYSLGTANVENRGVVSATLTNGNFVMAWGAVTSSEIHVQAQVFASPAGYTTPPTPLGGEITVGDSATNDYQPSLAALAGGGFVVVWQQGYAGATDIHARVFDANGVQTIPDFVVNTGATADHVNASVCALANGGFAVAWSNEDDQTIRARAFDAAGTQTATEFIVNIASPVPTSGTAPTAMTNGDGFLVSWTSASPTSAGTDLHLRGFDSTGVENLPEFTDGSGQTAKLDAVTALLQADGMVGGYVTVWVEPEYELQGVNLVLVDFDIMGQVYDLQGHMLGGRFQVNLGYDYFSAAGGTPKVQGKPAIASDATGQFIVAFTEHPNDTQTGTSIAAAGLVIRDSFTGTSGADELFGNNSPIVQDTLEGLAGNDVLHGRGGRDFLLGRDGDDILIGGAGADRLYGEDGIDTASYANAPRGVFADLTHTLFTTFYLGSPNNDAQGDEYFYVENLTGSRFGDTLYGDSGTNVINGGQGDDSLIGRGGGDTYIGGGGFDSVSYAGATGAFYMQVDLANPAANVGAAAGEAITRSSASSVCPMA